jgi:hypothetical protein
MARRADAAAIQHFKIIMADVPSGNITRTKVEFLLTAVLLGRSTTSSPAFGICFNWSRDANAAAAPNAALCRP